MENWIEIISFTLPQDAYLVKGRLESEGIEIILKDELTVQVYNFYSNAIGGVKLLVKECDYDKAYTILVESKYIKVEEKKEKKANKFMSNFDRFSAKLPLIGKSLLEFRLIIVAFILLTIIIVPIAVLSIPSTFEKLTGTSWYIESIYFNGKEIKPNSYGLAIVTNDNSYETIYFSEKGDVNFPGINSYSIPNKWELKNDSIIIKSNKIITDNSNYDSIQSKVSSFYEGKYKLEISENYFKMKSSNIIIIGRRY
ncbi:MAG: DUF2007 domain-containing protein [Paludibacter sp.]|nr:DUF2007 domain-containing protein [Paludibacter sp.]